MENFKKLSEVEVLETASDEATVLVEEGGEIRRVPKKEVGGGASGYIIELSKSTFLNGAFHMNDNYDELYDILVAGGIAWADYTNAPNSGSGGSSGPMSISDIHQYGPQHAVVGFWMLTDAGLFLMDALNDTPIFYPNGSHNLPAAEPV